jgi:hypothetical protein
LHCSRRLQLEFLLLLSTTHSNSKQTAHVTIKEDDVGDQENNIFKRQESAYFDDDLASAEVFKKAADKGGALMCAMAGTDRTAGLMLKDTRTPPSAASV